MRFLICDLRFAIGRRPAPTVRAVVATNRKSKINNRKSKSAFTLIEVLIVVTIIGIAGAIIVPHMLTAGTMGVQAAARMVIADLLYAQNEAIANQQPRQVVFNVAENSYRLATGSDGTGSTISVDWKGGDVENYEIDFDRETGRFGRMKIKSADFGGQPYVAFDPLGSPSSGGTVELEFQDTIYRVKVAGFTGRVTVEKVVSGSE